MASFRSLKEILNDLHVYHGKQQQWLRLQERFVWEQSPLESQLESQIFAYKSEKLNSMLSNYGQRCVQRTSDDSKSAIICDFIDQQTASNFVDVTASLQKLLETVESETQKIDEQMAKNKKYSINKQRKFVPKEDIVIMKADEDIPTDESNMPQVLHSLYSTYLSTSSNLYFDSASWPTKEDCMSWDLVLDEKDNLDLPVFLPPENKGFQ